MSKVVFMEHPELNKLLKRDDVFINLEEILILNTDIEEEGSGVFVIYCKTEESNTRITSFLKDEGKYFTTNVDLIVRVILDENDVVNVIKECHEMNNGYHLIQNECDSSEQSDSSERSDSSEQSDSSERSDSSEQSDSSKRSDSSEHMNIVEKYCDVEGCKCINCSNEYNELNETICSVDCKCVNCSA
jgi:hypothetical protein